MKKTGILATAGVLAFLVPAAALAATSATSTVSSGCNAATIQHNADTIYNDTLARADQQIPQPSTLTGCIGSLTGFSLSIPGFNLDGLLSRLEKEACSIASNSISTIKNTAINKVNQQIYQNGGKYLPQSSNLTPTLQNGTTSTPISVQKNGGGTAAVNNLTGAVVNQAQGKANNTLSNILGGP